MWGKIGLVKAITNYIDNTYNYKNISWYSNIYLINAHYNSYNDQLITIKLIYKGYKNGKDITFNNKINFNQLKKAIDTLFIDNKTCNICMEKLPKQYIACKECINYFCIECINNIIKYNKNPLCPYCRTEI